MSSFSSAPYGTYFASVHTVQTWDDTIPFATHSGRPVWITACHFTWTYEEQRKKFHAVLNTAWLL